MVLIGKNKLQRNSLIAIIETRRTQRDVSENQAQNLMILARKGVIHKTYIVKTQKVCHAKGLQVEPTSVDSGGISTDLLLLLEIEQRRFLKQGKLYGHISGTTASERTLCALQL